MPVEFKELQTIVHCRGDILTLPFSPKNEGCQGVAWLLLQEREEGKIGRLAPEEGAVCLQEQPGVFIAADDPASLDVIIDALVSLRNDLVAIRQAQEQKEAADAAPPTVQEYRVKDAPPFVAGLRFESMDTYFVGGHPVKVCHWPKGFARMNVVGKVVVIDGSLYVVNSVEFGGNTVSSVQPIGLVVVPYKRPVPTEDDL